MPNRSTRDFMQGTLHQFGKSLGLVSDDPEPGPPVKTAAPPASTTPVKTKPAMDADKLHNRTTAIDKAIDDAS